MSVSVSVSVVLVVLVLVVCVCVSFWCRVCASLVGGRSGVDGCSSIGGSFVNLLMNGQGFMDLRLLVLLT